MSLLDEFDELQRKAAARLKELEPYVAEHAELTQLLERLGVGRDEPTQPSAADPPKSRGRRTRAPKPAAAPRRSRATRKPKVDAPADDAAPTDTDHRQPRRR